MDLCRPLLAIPVVDIDGTLFVQLGIYLGLVIILGPLLFKPWLAAQERRTQAVEGALSKSKTLRAEADELGKDYDQRLEVAREQAHGVRSEARREEETAQGIKLAAIRDDAASTLTSARERITSETNTARDALAGRVDELADAIATKLLGRAS